MYTQEIMIIIWVAYNCTCTRISVLFLSRFRNDDYHIHGIVVYALCMVVHNKLSVYSYRVVLIIKVFNNCCMFYKYMYIC